MVNPNPEFWRDRSVFLTGHTGFKGAWLSLWLKKLGARVSGYSLDPPSQPSLFEMAGSETVDHHSRNDIRDLAALSAAMQQAKPSVVLHLAAQALVRPSYDNPVATYETNVMGTVNLLEAVRATDTVRSVVSVTSDKCYENREWHWAYRENEALGGHDPYSSSKGCAELVTSSYRRSFFTAEQAPALATARAGNVIGGGDWALDRLVPDCVRSFQKGDTVIIRNPASTRPWQHVLDPLCGYLALAERLAENDDRAIYAEAWNFGPSEDDAVPVQNLLEQMVTLWGADATWKLDNDAQPHEATYLKIDASKARFRLDWRRRLPVEQSVAWTIDWYRRQAEGEGAAALCNEQIERFESLG